MFVFTLLYLGNVFIIILYKNSIICKKQSIICVDYGNNACYDKCKESQKRSKESRKWME